MEDNNNCTREALYDQYCNVLKEHAKNATHLSLFVRSTVMEQNLVCILGEENARLCWDILSGERRSYGDGSLECLMVEILDKIAHNSLIIAMDNNISDRERGYLATKIRDDSWAINRVLENLVACSREFTGDIMSNFIYSTTKSWVALSAVIRCDESN